MITRCLLLTAFLAVNSALGQTPTPPPEFPYQSPDDFAKYAQQLHESTAFSLKPQVVMPASGGADASAAALGYPWKMNIVCGVFAAGEKGHEGAAWDPHWTSSYGGKDPVNPSLRRDYIPIAFMPRLNPFYCALPYNDVAQGVTKPEAYQIIPWFRQVFERSGKSVCQNRWIAIRSRGGKVCYAQWSDCGPSGDDHWQYVFGHDVPKKNVNGGQGLEVSPAVRDFLGLGTKDPCDWKFVEYRDVPPGPWTRYGENNDFVLDARKANERR